MPKVLIKLWTIFESPADYPGKFVVRRFDIVECGFGPLPAESYFIADSLESARLRIPAGKVKVRRSPDDDQCIVETWL